MRCNLSFRFAFLIAISIAHCASVRAGTIKGRDGTLQIELSDDWKPARIPADKTDDAQLMAKNARLSAGVMVIVEDATDSTKTLDDYMKSVTEEFSKNFGDAVHTDPKTARVNGKDALRCEIKCTVEGVKVGYVVTAIKVDAHYDRVDAWCNQEDFNRLKAALGNLAGDLRDLPPKPDVVIDGKDGGIQIKLPDGWNQTPLPLDGGPAMQALAQNLRIRAGLLVFSQNRSDTTRSLKENLQDTLDSFAKQFPDFSASEIESIKVSGHDAVRSVAKVTIKDTKLDYVFTDIQTDTHFHLVQVECLDSKFDKLKTSLFKLAERLKETSAKIRTDQDSGFVGHPVVLKAKDSSVQITLPFGWKAGEASKDDAVKVTANNLQQGIGLMVVLENREQWTTSLKQYSDQVAKVYASETDITEPSHTDPVAEKVNDMDAMQFEFHCVAGGNKVAYLITTIQSSKNFIRVVSWSIESNFDKLKPTLEKLPVGIKEMAAGSDDQ